MLPRASLPTLQSRTMSPHRRRDFHHLEINRFGLHGLAGDLIQTKPNPLTISILEEIKFLPKNYRGQTSRAIESLRSRQAGLEIRAQGSQPPKIRSGGGSDEWTTPGQLGFSGQNFAPLKLRRVFGRSVKVKEVLNFTGIHGSHVAYVASNVLIIFDYYHNTQSVLQGHQFPIVAFAKDNHYHYVVTADSGHTETFQSPVLVVWNILTGFPVTSARLTSNDPSGLWNDIVALAFLSGRHTQYIAVLHHVKDQTLPSDPEEGTTSPPHQSQLTQLLSLWNFSDNRELHLEASVTLPFKKTSLLHTNVVASCDTCGHFVTFGRATIVFYTWLRHEKRIASHQAKGHLKVLSRIGEFTAAIWITDSVLVATTKGHLVEFKAQKPLGLEPLPDPHLNVKEFRRYIRIQENVAFTAMVFHKNFIVIGDSEGGVRFLDLKFRILRWTRRNHEGVIHSIAFNSSPIQPRWKHEMQSTYSNGGYDHNTFHREENSAVYDYTYGGTKYRVPSETTLERKPLYGDEESLDMVVGYDNGSIAYFHIAEEKVDVILAEALVKGVTAEVVMDVSPTITHFALCTSDSQFQLFDYNINELLFSKKLFEKDVKISTLKFHPSGAFLVLASTKGTLYFRRSFTIGLLDSPLQIGKTKIERLEFSSCGLYLGIYDISNTVTLCNFSASRILWTIKGKHQSHYKKIVDLCFFKDPQLDFQRFFSLGEDRRLIEYDLAGSQAVSGLAILKVTILEPTAIPTAMVFAPAFPEHGALLHYATTNNKIRIFDQDALKIRKTCQGPAYGSPITRMVCIDTDLSISGTSKLIVTVQGQKLGLTKTPVDGNPFKSMAVFAHPGVIQNVSVGSEGREILTLGNIDSAVFLWTPEVLVMENSEMAGGHGVTPFKRYLDFGLSPGNSLVSDIENIFYHMMLKAADSQEEFLRMSRRIPISEIPTVMRTCGYFPQEQEIEQILEEASFLLGLKFGVAQDEIGFDNFLVLFSNHKDNGVPIEEVHRAFDFLGEQNCQAEACIAREKFVNLITTKAEKLQEVDLPHFLPNFYLLPKIPIEPVVTKRPASSWNFSTSENSNAFLSAISVKSDLSIDSAEGNSTISLDHEGVESSGISTLLFENNGSDPIQTSNESVLEATNAHSRVIEDEEWIQPLPEMPRDITTNFFIQQLLPDDASGALNLIRNELSDDLNDLYRISEEHPSGQEMTTILERWKGRDKWRYLTGIFEKLRCDTVPLDERLRTAGELDYICRLSSRVQDGLLDTVEVESETEENIGAEEDEGAKSISRGMNSPEGDPIGLEISAEPEKMPEKDFPSVGLSTLDLEVMTAGEVDLSNEEMGTEDEGTIDEFEENSESLMHFKS